MIRIDIPDRRAHCTNHQNVVTRPPGKHNTSLQRTLPSAMAAIASDDEHRARPAPEKPNTVEERKKESAPMLVRTDGQYSVYQLGRVEFDVEARYEPKEHFGQGAYGVVWYAHVCKYSPVDCHGNGLWGRGPCSCLAVCSNH